MKICLLSNALATHTQRWAKAFAQRGHQVHLLSIRKADIDGVTVHTVNIGPVNSSSKIWTFLSYLYLLLTARRIIKKINPDIINAHYAITHGVIAAFANIHPFVLTVWGSDIIWHRSSKMPKIMEGLIRYSLSRADLICAASKYLINQTRLYSPPKAVFEQTSFGVDCGLFAPQADSAAKDSSHLKVGFVKKLTSIYGPDVLVKAFALVARQIPDAKLVMAGSGKMLTTLKELSVELNIAEKIEFTGFIPNDKVPQLLNTFDVFVNPSTCRESFGVAVLEASACGVAVVATGVGGVPEVCIDGKTGFLVEPDNPPLLAQAIIKLLQDKQKRTVFGLAGREFVLQQYSWQECVNQKLNLFSGLIQKTGKLS